MEKGEEVYEFNMMMWMIIKIEFIFNLCFLYLGKVFIKSVFLLFNMFENFDVFNCFVCVKMDVEYM